MGAASYSEIREQLDQVMDPCSEAHGTPLSIIEMGLLDEIVVDGEEVIVQIHITSPVCTMVSHFIEEVETNVGELDGVESVTLETDSGLQWHSDMMSEEAKAHREERKRQLAELARAADTDTLSDASPIPSSENVSS